MSTASTRSVRDLLVYNSATNLAVKLYSNYQRRLEARACDIVKERKKRELRLQTRNSKPKTTNLGTPRLERLRRHISLRRRRRSV